jgi:hypothetical protein
MFKVKSERSADLIQKNSLMCKLLALKADDRDTEREMLVAEIYQTAEQMGDMLNNDRKLLIEQWVNSYHHLSLDSLERIKKEAKMSLVATTISEHIRNEGKLEGKIEGKLEGKIEGQIQILDDLFLSGILNREQYESMVQPLRKQLQHILDGFEYAGSPPVRPERPIRKTGKSKSKS